YESFGEELAGRTDLDFVSRDDGASIAFRSWQAGHDARQRILDGHPNFALGLVPSRMHRLHTFLTHMFVHGGLMHLLGNMLFLWVVGCLLEDSWGRLPFLAFYLAGGMLAGLAHCLQDTSSAVPLIGASGAIAAAMGAFTIRHFMTKIRFFYFVLFFFRPLWGTFFVPACVFLPLWFVQQLVMKTLADFVGATGVAYFAHIAGYFVGVVTALVFRATGFEEDVLAPRVRDRQIRAGVARDPRFDRACALMAQHRTEQARSLFDRLVADNPDDAGLLQDVAAVYREAGLTDEHVELSERALRGLLVAGRHEEASIIALDAAHRPEPPGINPRYLMTAGRWLAGQESWGDASDCFRAVVRSDAPPQLAAKASIALARILGGPMGYPFDAMRVLDEALDLDIDDTLRGRVEELRASIDRSAAAEVPI
ncbi:MAG TPA: rhomboid family intramembrane serine protease, partial [Alphaproteobacteria bacterium]|nr:rhomboid family intramembrane serine protease [Alphaproteobacteria bacterium]